MTSKHLQHFIWVFLVGKMTECKVPIDCQHKVGFFGLSVRTVW